MNRYILRAEDATNDMYASIDGVVDKLERQVRKYKTKINRKGKAQIINEVPVVEEESEIIKTKSFVVKPMDEEEAIMQMNLLGHEYFVYEDQETEDIHVVYKRKDGAYGLIETHK